jgi:hypothetical protein
MPRRDQRAKWVRTGRIEKAHLDDHNMKTIRQALGGDPATLAGQLAK